MPEQVITNQFDDIQTSLLEDIATKIALSLLTDEEKNGTHEEQVAFMKELEDFYREMYLDFRPPKFYQHPLNYLKLWRSVTRLGGYDRIMDPKMDSGIVSRYYFVDEAIENGVAPVSISLDRTVDVQCVMDIMDHLFTCEATWHKGHSLVQTVFSCIYLLRPDRATSHSLLHSYCRVIRATCSAIVSVVNDARTHEEEDIFTMTYGLPLKWWETISAYQCFMLLGKQFLANCVLVKPHHLRRLLHKMYNLSETTYIIRRRKKGESIADLKGEEEKADEVEEEKEPNRYKTKKLQAFWWVI